MIHPHCLMNTKNLSKSNKKLVFFFPVLQLLYLTGFTAILIKKYVTPLTLIPFIFAIRIP
jgi:hypothetical protein